MQVHTVQPGSWLQYVIPLVVMAVVMALRARRVSQLRPLKLERLWVVPALYTLVVAGLVWSRPPVGWGWSFTILGLILGVAIGWQRGKTMHIHVDPETHELGQRASIAGLAFIGVLMVVKLGAKAEGGMMHLDVALLTDILAALALGMIATQRLEMFLRARRLLALARGGGVPA